MTVFAKAIVAPLLAQILSGCAEGTWVREDPPDVSLESVRSGLKAVAASAKLSPPLEVSEPFPTQRISGTDWTMCLRSAASEEAKRRPYAVFIKSGALQDFRGSVIIEECETRTYKPLL